MGGRRWVLRRSADRTHSTGRAGRGQWRHRPGPRRARCRGHGRGTARGEPGSVVIGTASDANHDYLTSLGAIPVSYGAGLADRVRAVAPGGVDAALDGAGGDALAVSLELVDDRSRILTLVEHGRAHELGVTVTPNLRSAARLAELAGRYAAGELRFLVRRTYPLSGAADAHREVEKGHGRGKVVLEMEP